MDKYIPGMVPEPRPLGRAAKPRWMSMEQWERKPPTHEPRPVIGVGMVLLIGAVVVASFCLMVLGALKLGELVRAVVGG
jgi:hypothetical protein